MTADDVRDTSQPFGGHLSKTPLKNSVTKKEVEYVLDVVIRGDS